MLSFNYAPKACCRLKYKQLMQLMKNSEEVKSISIFWAGCSHDFDTLEGFECQKRSEKAFDERRRRREEGSGGGGERRRPSKAGGAQELLQPCVATKRKVFWCRLVPPTSPSVYWQPWKKIERHRFSCCLLLINRRQRRVKANHSGLEVKTIQLPFFGQQFWKLTLVWFSSTRFVC